jgi:hypothetical protein
MKLTIESTAHVVTLEKGDSKIPARVWTGKTESGIPCDVFITRVAVKDEGNNCAQFERELKEQQRPQPIQVWPLRMII